MVLKWSKLGHVFAQSGKSSWKLNSALTPTPFLLTADVIRVYAGFRDVEGVSRIGYVDVDSTDPKKIIGESSVPVLDVGRAGCFDDNGVILGDVIRHGNKIRMYYVGFQLVKRAKFLAFTGVAESDDGGETFQRVSEVPVMDRAPEASMIRAIHTARYEENRWKVWFAVGNGWELIDGKHFPQYDIWYAESPDGMSFQSKPIKCIDLQGDEYRIGRPSVYKTRGGYLMFYTKGGRSGKDYFPGIARSVDGIAWQRQDSEFGLTLSEQGFDSRHLCYPRLIKAHAKIFCFYNGNNMGAEGFGVAELLGEDIIDS